MKVLLLIGVLLIAQTWAKPKDVEEADNDLVEEESEDNGGYAQTPEQDPCYNHECPIGKECDLTEDGEATCVCAHKCTPETEDRAKVCSTTNVTFESECELERQKCLCQKHDDDRCLNKHYRHSTIDYYGECKEMAECSEQQLEDFPVRMREWLYLIMEELADRKELSKPANNLAKKAKKQKQQNKDKKHWVFPVIWKFCDLDRTHDLRVDPHELVPITAPLKAMEPCTGPFVEKCDENQDGTIEGVEWEKCLGLQEGESETERWCEKLRGEDEE